MKTFFFWIICSIFFLYHASCAGPKRRPKRKPTSKITKKISRPIAPSVSRNAIEHYRQMRLNNWANYTKKRPIRKYYPSNERIRKRPLNDSIPLSPERQKELEIQTEQYTTYFCMKHRRNRRFANPKHCKNHTQRVVSKCKARTEGEYGRRTPGCVKRGLSSLLP